MAAAAYCSDASLLSWTCKACDHVPVVRGSQVVHFSSKTNVRGYTAKLLDGAGLVSFRGTNSSDALNWIEDLKSAFKADYPYNGCTDCRVAEGFLEAYGLLREQVLREVKAMGLGPGSTVYVTGHSLGAAMAGLCAFDLKTMGYDVKGYTFGQPRDGDPTYSSTFSRLFPVSAGNWFRVTHNADIVVHLPPEFLGFHHTSQEVWYRNSSSSYKVCDGSGEDASCSDSVDLPISIDDHLHYLNVPISRSC